MARGPFVGILVMMAVAMSAFGQRGRADDIDGETCHETLWVVARDKSIEPSRRADAVARLARFHPPMHPGIMEFFRDPAEDPIVRWTAVAYHGRDQRVQHEKMATLARSEGDSPDFQAFLMRMDRCGIRYWGDVDTFSRTIRVHIHAHDRELREAALETLVYLEDAEAIKITLDELVSPKANSPRPEIAIRSLRYATPEDPQAIEELRRAVRPYLDHKDTATRIAAIRELAPDVKSRDRLRSFMRDDHHSREMRIAAIEALRGHDRYIEDALQILDQRPIDETIFTTTIHNLIGHMNFNKFTAGQFESVRATVAAQLANVKQTEACRRALREAQLVFEQSFRYREFADR